MKAVDFVKMVGWDFAMSFSNKGEQLIEARPYEIGRGFIDDLKTLVDAYELVQSYGGLYHAKENYKGRPFGENWNDLKQAIALVEEVGILGDCDE